MPLFNGSIASGPFSPAKPIPFAIGKITGLSITPPDAYGTILFLANTLPLALSTTPPFSNPKKLSNPGNKPNKVLKNNALTIIFCKSANIDRAKSPKLALPDTASSANPSASLLTALTASSPIFAPKSIADSATFFISSLKENVASLLCLNFSIISS